MGAAEQSISDATHALFALEQPLTLFELAASARERRFPSATTQTPGWFAAAAHDDYSLLETAPELLVLPTDLDSAARIDVTGIDLIHVYAPELAGADRIAHRLPAAEPPVAAASPPAAAAPVPPPELPSTSTQMGLLAELTDLDA